MKTLTVGDLHGKDVWKEIDTIRYDKIIFVGDYVDCFTTSNVEIKHNLEQIIRYKKDNMDKVVLLLGNHDVQYTTMSNSHLYVLVIDRLCYMTCIKYSIITMIFFR